MSADPKPRFPSPVPSGWFAVAFADALAPGALRSLSYLARGLVRQLRQDIPIWESQRYLERPLLCDGDGAIVVLRRWANPFYGAFA